MVNDMVVTQDERTNAALAHGSIVLGIFSRGVLGILVAFLIWITQRNKSAFAARQAAQATVYQLLGVLAAIVVWVAWGLLFAGSIAVPVLINPNRPEPLMPYLVIPAAVMIIFPLVVTFGWMVYGVYAAVQVWQGKDFSYPVIGSWVK